MINVLFICHGNICRSPMAEFVFKDMVKKEGLSESFHIESAATSNEEIGNPVHYGTREKLKPLGISVSGKTARRMTKKDYEKYDYLLAMDKNNIRNIMRIIDKDPDDKVHLLLEYTGSTRDIADPWYTGNFDVTYDNILEGCTAFLSYLKQTKNGLHKATS